MPALPTQHRTTRPLHIHTSTRAENETQKGHNRKNAHAESSSLVKHHQWRSMSETETINNPADTPTETHGGAVPTPEPEGVMLHVGKDKRGK